MRTVSDDVQRIMMTLMLTDVVAVPAPLYRCDRHHLDGSTYLEGSKSSKKLLLSTYIAESVRNFMHSQRSSLNQQETLVGFSHSP